MAGSAGLAWETADVLTAIRLNQKNTFMGTGAQISALTPTFAGMLAFCTSTGSGFVLDNYYKRNNANTTWTKLTAGQTLDQVYPLDVTIGNYASPTDAVGSSTATTTPTADFTEAYTTNTGWTQTGTLATVNSGVAGKFACVAVDLTTNNRVTKSLGITLSNSIFQADFEFTVTAMAAARQAVIIGLTDTTGGIVSADSIHVSAVESGGSILATIRSYNNGVSGATGAGITCSFSTLYYGRLTRTSTTSANCKIYSDSDRTIQVGSTDTVTISSGVIGLAYIQHGSIGAGNAGETGSYTVDNTTIYSGSVSTSFTASNAVDVSDTTFWKSTSTSNPNIYVDLGSAKELHAIALNINKTDTTETEIQIRASTDVTFTSPETVRTILISDFTNNTDRFITIPRAITDKRYVQIYGSSNSVVLAINNIKYLTKSAADFEKAHFHNFISSTAYDNSLDSN